MTELPADPRPRAVTTAFWCWLAGAVLLIVGGLLTTAVAVPLPTLFRGMGVVVAISGVGMAFVAGRTHAGDARYKRAAVALSMAIVVLVGVIALLGVLHICALLAPLALIAGTVAIRSSAAQTWFDREAR